MIAEYIQVAMQQAKFEQLEDHTGWYAEIPGLQGVWGEGATKDACRDDLQETLAAWLDLRSELDLPIPRVHGTEYGFEMEALSAELRAA